jgi:hypothetical protein
MFGLIGALCGKAYERVAYVAASSSGLLSSLLKVMMFLTVYPCCYLCILLDRRLYVRQKTLPGRPLTRNPLIRFPRRPREVREDPKVLFDILVANVPHVFAQPSSGIHGPTKIVFADASTFAPLDTEPDKNEAVIRIVYKYYILPAGRQKGAVGSAADIYALDIFLKTPSVREFSVSLKALSATFSILPKEVIWFSKFMPAATADGTPFPLPVPAPVYAEYARLFDTYITVTRTVAGSGSGLYKAIPDWRMEDIRKARHMMRVIGAFHAATWDIRGSKEPRTLGFFQRYFPGELRSSVNWIDGGMSLFFAKRATPSMKKVWAALSGRLQKEPLVMSHGDFRPGNMLWNSAEEKLDLVVTDMELATVTPYMWDASYMMFIGLPVGTRREQQAALLSDYLTELHAALKKTRKGGSAEPAAPGSAAATSLHQLLGLALFFYGWTLAVLGEMPDANAKQVSIQGNTSQDGNAWHERVVAMTEDLAGPTSTAESRAKLCAELGIVEAVLAEFYNDGMALLHARIKW